MRALAVFGLIGTLLFWRVGTSLGASPVQRCWYGTIQAYLTCGAGQSPAGMYLLRDGSNDREDPDPADPSGGSHGGTTGRDTGKSTGETTGGGTHTGDKDKGSKDRDGQGRDKDGKGGTDRDGQGRDKDGKGGKDRDGDDRDGD